MAIDDIRITRGQARYGRLQRLRAWLYHRAPWLPRWVTGWTTWHFRRPEVPFPTSDPYLANVSLLLHEEGINNGAKFGNTSVNYSGSFGEQVTTYETGMSPNDLTLPVIKAVQGSVAVRLRPGWHTATITFRIDEAGNPILAKDYKISSFGEG